MFSSAFARLIADIGSAFRRLLETLFGFRLARARASYEIKDPYQLRKAVVMKLWDNPGHEFTPQQLSLLVGPPSPEALAVVLDQLTREGKVRRIFRVESPQSHSGIKDFTSVTEIPEVLYDWTVDRDVEVLPELIQPIFSSARQ